MSSNLNSDTKADQARALHRVVRAMHDGHCPSCGFIDEATTFKRYDLHNEVQRWLCPECKFAVTREEADEALHLFQPFMRANLEVFKKWRLDRITQQAKHNALVVLNGIKRHCKVTAVGDISGVYTGQDVVIVKTDGTVDSNNAKVPFCYLAIEDWNSGTPVE